MLTPLINGSLYLFLFILFGPGAFSLGYWSLRMRDKDDSRLGAKALLAYLGALTLQAALASAAFLWWVILEYIAGRFDAPPPGTTPSGNWKGAFGTLLLHSLLSIFFSWMLKKIEPVPNAPAIRFFRGFGAYLCSLISLVALSLFSWSLFATVDPPTLSMAYAALLSYFPVGLVLSFLLIRHPKISA